MRRYLLQSVAFHASIFLLFILFSILRPSTNIIWLEGPGFEFGGGGGGGDGKLKGGGLKAEKRGQVVPKPSKAVIPDKPAPLQKATRADKGWKVKDQKVIPAPKVIKKKQKDIPIGEKDQQAQSNIIRKGVAKDSQSGSNEYDFGEGGLGQGKGVGIGLGSGPGSGFGFGSYLSIMRRRIWSEWTQTAVIGSDKSCVVALTVTKSGAVTSIRLSESSGDAFFDNVARRAVRNASPLPPLPPGFPKSEQEFRIKFKLLD